MVYVNASFHAASEKSEDYFWDRLKDVQQILNWKLFILINMTPKAILDTPKYFIQKLKAIWEE